MNELSSEPSFDQIPISQWQNVTHKNMVDISDIFAQLRDFDLEVPEFPDNTEEALKAAIDLLADVEFWESIPEDLDLSFSTLDQNKVFQESVDNEIESIRMAMYDIAKARTKDSLADSNEELQHAVAELQTLTSQMNDFNVWSEKMHDKYGLRFALTNAIQACI